MKVLLVINARVDELSRHAISAGLSPRKDYCELEERLGADVIDLAFVERNSLARLVRRLAGAAVAQALVATVLSPRYDAVFVDRETTGFIVAALSRLHRKRPRLSVIGHLLSPPKKQILFRALRLKRVVDCLVVHSTLQRRIAEAELGMPRERVALLPYQADDTFWTPLDVPVRRQICSAGLEYRDYPTMIEAIRGLHVEVIIGAASHWSKHQSIDAAGVPGNLCVASFDYPALRRLYAESLFVVVPLLDVDNQAGITTILEAMAMGKAVIVSHTRGQMDVIRDRRNRNRSDASRVTQPDWASRLGATGEVAAGQTGIYVMPGDAAELRRAIVYLLDHPEHAAAMGANARRFVESVMGLDAFTERLSAAIAGTAALSPAPANLTHLTPMEA